MWLFNFFKTNTTETKPAIKGVTLGSIGARIAFKYDNSLDVYYGFYNKNPYVMSTINRIKQDVASNGVELRIQDEPTDITQFTDLLSTTFQKFKERIVRDYEVTGNVYIYVDRDEGDNVVGLDILDPRYITPVTDERGNVLGYVQNLAGIRAFSADEVYHLKDDTDTEDETLGKSKMSSLYLDLMSDKEASESNYSFFANNQTPSSIVVLEETVWDKDVESLKKVKDLFSTENYGGGKNNNRTAFVEGIKEVIQIQQRMDDAEFLNLRRFSLEMVCSVYGVPKDILWFTESSNRSVWDVQSETYWNNINTIDSVFEEFLDMIVKDVLGEEYSFVILRDSLRILERRMKIAKEAYKESGLLSLNEAREIIQYEEREDGNEVYKEKSLEKVESKVEL